MSVNSALLKKMTDDSMIGLAIFHESDLTCGYINSMARNILEYFDEEYSHLNLQHLFTETAKAPFRNFQKEILGNEGLLEDIMVRKTTGVNFIASLGIRKLTENNEAFIMIMVQDVTFQKKLQREVAIKQDEIKKTYEEIMSQNKALMELDKAKDKFIALVTHELRTPLSAIIATTEFLHMKFYGNEKQLEDYISSILTEGHHLLAIVNDILDFSKIQTGKMEFYLEKSNPSKMIEKQVEALKQMAETNQVTLHFEPHDEYPECYFDGLRLNQIIANVLSNAIKFNKKGGTVLIQVLDKESTVEITIEDEGMGIPKKFESKVFDEFETIENIKTHQKGTGLGMPISKKLIEGMGGTIHFSSEEGIGTTFFINIPKEKVLEETHYRSRPDLGGDLLAS